VKFGEYVTGGVVKVPEKWVQSEHFWLVWTFHRTRGMQ
jgi:hypothetical protein